MSWNAKPKYGYDIDSDEAHENILQIYGQLQGTWTVEAVSGMLGNMYAESGLNPWRWQSDKVDLTSDTKGYGLAQFTPAYGYIDDYGVGVEGYAPNLSVDEQTEGADPSDGKAQIIVIDEDKASKFVGDRAKLCHYRNIRNYNTFDKFKQCTSLQDATCVWLFNYEFPQDRSYSVYKTRYGYAKTIYEYLGHTPKVEHTKMPLWMMCRYRNF